MKISMNASITAIIPVFNAQETIAESLNSLINQTTSVDRIIVIDDGSTDNSPAIIEQFVNDNKIVKSINNNQNKGVSYSRNKGCFLAETDWVIFLDADDLIDNKLIEKAKEAISNSSSIVIHSAYQQIDEKGKIISGVTRFKQLTQGEILGYELVRNHVYLSGTLIKLSAFNDCGGFNPNIRLCEDWDLWIKLAQQGDFHYLDEPLVLVRRHEDNVSAKVEEITWASKQILSQYSFDFIRDAVYQRQLTVVQNAVDYVSILFLMDEWIKGGTVLKEQLNSDTDFFAIHFYLGLYSFHNNEFIQAEKYFEQATGLNDRDAGSLNNLGICIALNSTKSQSNKTSNQCFSEALNIATNYQDAEYNLTASNKGVLTKHYKLTSKILRPVLLHYQTDVLSLD